MLLWHDQATTLVPRPAKYISNMISNTHHSLVKAPAAVILCEGENTSVKERTQHDHTQMPHNLV